LKIHVACTISYFFLSLILCPLSSFYLHLHIKLWNNISIYGGGLEVPTPLILMYHLTPLPLRTALKVLSITKAGFVKLNWYRGCVQPFITLMFDWSIILLNVKLRLENGGQLKANSLTSLKLEFIINQWLSNGG
jgi:hypothetical protein